MEQKKEPTFKEILESNHYSQQKELVKKEINSRKIEIDRTVFKKTKEEKGQLYTMKMANKEALRRHYGSDWKRHLNIPERSLQTSIHLSF